MGDKIRVVIAGDQKLFREIIRLTLHKERDIEIVGEASNGRQTIDAIRNFKPDIVLLDSTMPKMNGIKVLPAIREKSQKTKALMITTDNDEVMIFKILKAGAKGYLSKNASISDLIKAIQTVHQGELWVERKLKARFLEGKAILDSRKESPIVGKKGVLTPREKEVLSILAKGYTNKEIAQTLSISERTVKSHLNNIFRKLNVTRRLKAILYAINRGLS